MKKYLFIKDTYGNYEPIYTDIEKGCLDVQFIIDGVEVYKIILDNNDNRISNHIGKLIFASDDLHKFSEMLTEFHKVEENLEEQAKRMKEYFKLHRITPSNKVNREYLVYSKDLQTQLGMKKLEMLEDFEEETGLDLILFAKANLQEKIYVKDDYGHIIECSVYNFFRNKMSDRIELYILLTFGYRWNGVMLKSNKELTYRVKEDYGITWALTKEELETDGK